MTDNLSLMFNYGTIDVDNSAFTLACELVTAVSQQSWVRWTRLALKESSGNSDSGQPEDSMSFRLADQEVGSGLFGQRRLQDGWRLPLSQHWRRC